MCWTKKKKQSEDAKVEEVLQQAKLDTLKNALQDILKMEYKKPPVAEGEAPADWELTVRMARTRARMALDVIATMDVAKEKEEK